MSDPVYGTFDTRDNFNTSFVPNRIPMTNVTANQATKFMDGNNIFAVSTINELNKISSDYKDTLGMGDMAILFDISHDPSKLYVWQPITNDWRVMPDLSVAGMTLTDASTIDKGVVFFAAHNEVTANKALQANDPRLNKEWVAQSLEPVDKNVLWIDTTSDPVIKMFSGSAWQIVSGKKIIDDVFASLSSTYSSQKVDDLLLAKAPTNHSHSELAAHIANASNPHKVTAAQVIGLKESIDTNSTVKTAFDAKHDHGNKLVLDKISVISGVVHYDGNPICQSDMNKTVYDKNKNGIVDAAETLSNGIETFDIIRIFAMENKAHVHNNISILNGTTASFTSELKTKIDGVEAGANKYIHPAAHVASMITEDADHMFVKQSDITNWNDKYPVSVIDSKLIEKENKSNKGIANGYASLDLGGKVPLDQLPAIYKESKVVSDILERDVLTKFVGLRVLVADASADPAVGSGSADYAWAGTKWVLLNSTNKMIVNDWKAGDLYTKNELIMFNNILYRANVTHTASTSFDITKWNKVL